MQCRECGGHKESIELVLGDAVEVRTTTKESKLLVLEIVGFDSITTKREIFAAIASQFSFAA